MGGKKLLIMCMFLFLVLGINTIYASDINDTQTINAATESDEIDKLSVNGDNDKLSVNEYTFQNLADKIDATNEGDTLNLSADDLYKNTDSYSVNGIVISKNIIINGNGATIDGNNVGRIFNITANNVVLKNLTFINGYAFRGGAIFTENLKIYDCNFINNSANVYGGAIDGADHLTIEVYNSYFRNNSATNENLSYGGAICSKEAHIYNSTFEFNSAINGGAINGLTEVTVFNSTFVNNTAIQDGGAVASLFNLNVDNSTFINNTAYLYGGALYVLTVAEISNSNFFMNKATVDGGAVRVNSLTVKTSNFVNNSAYQYGGAIFANNQATVEKSNFTQNNAQFGGAVSSRKIKADDLIFRNNTANLYGGAIFSDNMDVKNSLIMSNKAQKGGAICINVTSSSNVILECCVIYNNIADSGFEIDTFNDVDLPKSNLNGNWWGNTILNLKDRPNVSAAFNLTNWVYLDMELDIPTIKLNEDENITLVLSHLANETGKLNINHTISLVHFNLTSTGGSINKDYLELPSGTGKFVYHVSESDNNAILGKFYEYNFKFPLYFAVPPVIQISRPDEILFKESGNITVTVVNATGFVNITVGSQVFNNVKLNNSKATVSVKGLVLGENTINVTYGGDGYHLIGNASDKFNVVKNHVLPVILINCSNVIYVNEFNNITVLVVNGTGFVNITVGSQVFNDVELNNSRASVLVKGLVLGENTVNVAYSGDNYFTNGTNSAKFNVVKKSPVIQINCSSEILFDEFNNITVVVVNGTGFVNITVGSQVFNDVELNNSRASVLVKGLVLGENTVNVAYSGDNHYTNGTNSTKFNVIEKLIPPVINIIVPEEIILGETKNITVVVVNGTGFVNITVGSQVFNNVKLDNSTATVPVKGIDLGENIVNVAYSGDNKYLNATALAKFNVNKGPDYHISLTDNHNMKVYYLVGSKYSVRVVDSNGNPVSGITVNFVMGGKKYTAVSDAKGYAKVPITLAPGKYRVTATADDSSVSNKIKVKSVIHATKYVKAKKGNTTKSKVVLLGLKSKIVKKPKFRYLGKKKVKFNAGPELAGKHIDVKFRDEYFSTKVNKHGVATISINKKLAKQLHLKKGGKYKLRAVYKKSVLFKHQKFSIKFNGKKYNFKTNAKGKCVIKFTPKMINSLKVGKKYPYHIKFKQNKAKRYVIVKK